MANFNLFDFSSVEKPRESATFSPEYASIPTNPSMPTLGFGGVSNIKQYNPSTMSEYSTQVMSKAKEIAPTFRASQPVQKESSMMDSIIPKASARGNLIQMYLDDPAQDLDTKKEIMKAIENGDEDVIMQSLADGGYKGPAEKPQEGLGITRSIGEGIIGATRAGEQIPRMLGNIGKFTGDIMGAPYEASKSLFGEEAGLTSFLAPGAKQSQRAGLEAQALGEEITRAGMTDGGTNKLTEEQIKARKMGGDIVITSVLPVGQIAKAKTALGALKTGAKVGAISTPQFTVATEGRLPTLGEQALGTTGGAILGPAFYGAGKLLTKSAPSVTGKVAQEGAEDIGKLGLKTEEGIINGQKVTITRPKSGIIETVTSLLRSKDTKVLVGKALTPSYAGKTPKQIVQSSKNTEANATKLHELVRTGKFEGNIDTLQDTAETIVKNIDTVGERIGTAIGSLKGSKSLSMGIRAEMSRALKSKVEVDAGAYGPLKKFWTRTKGETNYGDLFKIKKIYSSEIKKLIKSGDAGTDSFSALVKGVQEISNILDDAVEKKLVGTQYADDKAYYKLLKEMVSDVAKSSAVEGRRAPQTFIEQLGYLDALTSPTQAAKQLFAREIGEMNTRGGTWKQFVKILDDRAVEEAKKIPKVVKKPKTGIIKKPAPIKGVTEKAKPLITPPKPTQAPTIPKPAPIKGITEKVNPNSPTYTTNVQPKGLKPNSPTTPDSKVSEGYIKNPFNGKIEKINQSKKGSLNIGQIGKDLGLVNKGDDLKSLIEEAKKYKSAEEFMKAQGEPFYHGSNSAKIINKEGFKEMPIQTGNAYGKGTYLTVDKKDAQGYIYKGNNYQLLEKAKKSTTLNEFIGKILPGAKDSSISESTLKQLKGVFEQSRKDTSGVVTSFLPKGSKLYKSSQSDIGNIDTKKLINEGYAGVSIDGGRNIVVFNPSSIKTKSQLTDIYNQANKPTGLINKLDLSKNKKGSLNIGEIGKSMGLKEKSVGTEKIDVYRKYDTKGNLTAESLKPKEGYVKEQKTIKKIIKPIEEKKPEFENPDNFFSGDFTSRHVYPIGGNIVIKDLPGIKGIKEVSAKSSKGDKFSLPDYVTKDGGIGGNGVEIEMSNGNRAHLVIHNRPDSIILDQIVVKNKGDGLGSNIMEYLKKKSDKTGKTLIIAKPTASAKSFYRKFDFLKEYDNHLSFEYEPKK